MSSPVKIAKPRGLQGQKKKEKIRQTVVLEEFGDEQRSIEREPTKKKIGVFKVYKKDMTFEWKDGTNRKLADPIRTVALRESMRQGIFRWDVGHRMTGCVSKKNIGPCIDPNNTQKAIKLEEVE